MNKSEFIEAIASKSGSTITATTEMVNALTDVVCETLQKNEKIQLTGFGSFEATEKAARMGRNPKTGEAIQIPAKRVAKFKAGKAIEDALK